MKFSVIQTKGENMINVVKNVLMNKECSKEGDIRLIFSEISLEEEGK